MFYLINLKTRERRAPNQTMIFKSISPRELHEKLQNAENFQLIDVREAEEFAVAKIEGAKLLPLSEFHLWQNKLNPEDEIVVMCHHGIRSGQVCGYLAENKFENVWNLSGGIDAWSKEVDQGVPRY